MTHAQRVIVNAYWLNNHSLLAHINHVPVPSNLTYAQSMLFIREYIIAEIIQLEAI